VQPVLRDRAGNVWFGSRMGLSRFKDGKYENFYHADKPSERRAWRNIVSAIYEDRDGTIWAGTWNGLSKRKGSHLVSDSVSEEIQGGISAIFRDRAGDLWVGSDRGLYRIHGGHCTPLGRDGSLPDDSLRAQVIFEDRREAHSGSVPSTAWHASTKDIFPRSAPLLG
jgi:hypothetical protein